MQHNHLFSNKRSLFSLVILERIRRNDQNNKNLTQVLLLNFRPLATTCNVTFANEDSNYVGSNKCLSVIDITRLKFRIESFII